MTERVSLATLGAEQGIDYRTAKSCCDKAGLKRTRDGYDRDAAEAAIAIWADPELIAGHAAAGRGNVNLPEVAALAKARADSEFQRSRKLKIVNDQLEGKLVLRDVVQRDAEHIGTTTQQSFMSLGARLAPKLTNQPDARIIKTAIEEAVTEVLNDLSATLRRITS